MDIKAKFLVPMAGQAPTTNSVITYKETHISNIHTSEASIDSNLLVMPGFINNHTHLSYEPNSYPVESQKQLDWMTKLVRGSRSLSAEDKYQQSEHSIREVLRSGTTCVVDNTPFMETVESIIDSPLKGIIGYEVFFHREHDTDLPQTWSQYLQALEDIHTKIQTANRSDSLNATFSPHSIYTVRPSMLHQVAKWRQEQDQFALIHLAEFFFESLLTQQGVAPETLENYLQNMNNHHRPTIDTATTPGLTPVQYLNKLGLLSTKTLLTHMIDVSPDDYELISQSGASIISCPRSNSYLKNNTCQLTKMKQANLKASLATDSLGSNFDMDILEEAKHAYLIHHNLSAQEALESITSIPAAQIHRSHKIGSIEIGKKADIICFELTNDQIRRASQAFQDGNIHEFVIREIKTSQISQMYIDGQQISI